MKINKMKEMNEHSIYLKNFGGGGGGFKGKSFTSRIYIVEFLLYKSLRTSNDLYKIYL